MSISALYRSKRTNPEQAIWLVHDGDATIVPTDVGEPMAILRSTLASITPRRLLQNCA
jgi:hypothetical protein